MIWEVILIAAIVITLLILARRIPEAQKFQKSDEPEISDEQMTTFGLISRADDLFDKKNYRQAEELYVKAAMKEPTNPKIYNHLGAIYLEQKDYYDAKEAFLQALKLEVDKASAHNNLGLAYMGLKDYFKAEQEFEAALKKDPKNKKYQHFLEKAKKRK